MLLRLEVIVYWFRARVISGQKIRAMLLVATKNIWAIERNVPTGVVGELSFRKVVKTKVG